VKEWFKARNVWGAAMLGLSDEEAGRLAKAIWEYTMNEEIVEIEGAGKGIFAMILMTLKQDEEYEAGLSKVRAIAGSKGGKQKQANILKTLQTEANDTKCYQNVANDSNCYNKNKNKNKKEEQESETEYIDVDDAHKIQNDHDTLMDSAENAGFKMSNDVRDALIALYAAHGIEKVMNGLKSCVEHGAPNLAYLRACMTDTPKPVKAGKVISAQQYEQRDYDDEQAEAMRRMMKAVNA